MRNDNLIHSETYRGFGIEILQDDCPDSPRNGDNVGILCTQHRHYDLENETKINFSDFSSWGEIRDELVKTHKAIPSLVFPLYMLDHGSQHIRFNRDFSDCGEYGRWDSGMIGFIYVTRESLIHSLGYPQKFRLTPERQAHVTDILSQEIETWDDYGNGRVYGYCVTNPEGKECDSCFGFIGEDEDCLAEARKTVNYEISRRAQARLARLKTLIQKHVPLQYRQELLAQAVGQA